MEQKLLNYFSRILPLSQEEIDGIVATLTIKKFPKGTILLREGEISMEAYFVLEGCVRQYFIIEGEEKTAGGIIIPDTAKEKPQKGEIIATGKGRVTEDGKVLPLEVKIGDKVLFSKYAGTELKLEGQEYLMMREEDILGVFN